MFFHLHPYKPFIPPHISKLIVGTLPPPRFSQGILKTKDVDFCYGSSDGMLWPILDAIFKVGFRYDNSEEAILERKEFLKQRGIGICDIVASCERQKIDSSDLGMSNIKLRDLIGYLKKFPTIDTLLFTGGNSKNGPEYLFRKHLKDHGLNLNCVADEVPRVHQLLIDRRLIKTVSLTAPSGSANRAIGSMELYKTFKKKNPNFNTFEFRVSQYRNFF